MSIFFILDFVDESLVSSIYIYFSEQWLILLIKWGDCYRLNKPKQNEEHPQTQELHKSIWNHQSSAKHMLIAYAHGKNL